MRLSHLVGLLAAVLAFATPAAASGRCLSQLPRGDLHHRPRHQAARRPGDVRSRFRPRFLAAPLRQGLYRGLPRPRVCDRRRARDGQARVPGEGHPDLRRHHPRRGRFGRPVRHFRLREPRRPRRMRDGGPPHRPALRRSDPRRLLLLHLQVRRRHRRQGQPQLDRLSRRQDARGEPRPGARRLPSRRTRGSG